MAKIIAGLVLGLLIGAACRWFDVPLPGPPKFVGAMLVVAITVGYMATDKLIAAKFSSKGPATTEEMCGGPTGEVISGRGSRIAAPKVAAEND
jgi:XapX domain-containing protein